MPTTIHHRAIERFVASERIAPINEFLRQNSAQFEDFLAREQAYIPTTFTLKRAKPGSTIKTTFSHAWDSQIELNLLTHAILWLDNLLAPFRMAIVQEDLNELKPSIEQSVREFEATEVSSKIRKGEPLSIADQKIVRRFSDSIHRIQSSNSLRRQLLERININVSTFENLLLSAENIRYRRDLGREFGQTNDLVDGLRRIYGIITCTIPVSLSEQDAIQQPAEPHKIIYGGGPFHPYKLPGRPEIFDHPSISVTRVGTTEATGIQQNEHQTPLSHNYHSGLYHDMMGTIAAQKIDDVGAAKIRKNNKSMSRDWKAFYDPIYGSAMANYSETAA